MSKGKHRQSEKCLTFYAEWKEIKIHTYNLFKKQMKKQEWQNISYLLKI